jgi:nitronate monooxygenase
MGGGLAGAPLASAVAKAGGLGTLGLASPGQLRTSIDQVRAKAPDRAVAVNLLMPFVRRSHVAVCVDARVDVVVVAFGGDRKIVEHLRDAGIFVFVMVGTEAQAREAIDWGTDGLIAQGLEEGGHLVGTMPALDFLPHARAVAGERPVLLAGGIATGADTRAALHAGAAGVIAGTRFLLTQEANAHPEYQRRILDADKTIETTLFGLSWPLRHRVAPNAATRKWCRNDGTAKALPGRPQRIQPLASRARVSRRRCTHPGPVAGAAAVYTAGTSARHAEFVCGQRSTLSRRHSAADHRNHLCATGRRGPGALTVTSPAPVRIRPNASPRLSVTRRYRAAGVRP